MTETTVLLAEYINHFDKKLAVFWQEVEKDPNLIKNKRLLEAMQYSLNGGKRFRALLIYGVNQVAGNNINTATTCAIAIELFHAFTLIHDDLPALDNDSLRRGKPTSHVKFDESTAIMAGNGLHALAFYALSKNQVSDAIKTQMQILFAEHDFNVMSGQMMDLNHQKATYQEPELQEMCFAKTASLFSACLQLGVLSANVQSKTILADAGKLGKTLGLAFQIQDDILDVESNADQLGKSAGKDAEQNKTTFATLGLSQAKAKLKTLFAEIYALLDKLNWQDSILKGLIENIEKRSY